jgi:hypothetical protein
MGETAVNVLPAGVQLRYPVHQIHHAVDLQLHRHADTLQGGSFITNTLVQRVKLGKMDNAGSCASNERD